MTPPSRPSACAQPLADPAAIERRRAIRGDAVEGRGERRLAQGRARRGRPAVRQEERAAARVLEQGRQVHVQRGDVFARRRHAVARQCRGRRHQLGPGPAAEFLVQGLPRAQHARDRRAQRAARQLLGLDIGRQAGGRRPGAVESAGPALGVDQDEAIAAQGAGVGQSHGQNSGTGERRIDRVAALFQNARDASVASAWPDTTAKFRPVAAWVRTDCSMDRVLTIANRQYPY